MLIVTRFASLHPLFFTLCLLWLTHYSLCQYACCAVQTDGTGRCWGYFRSGAANVPAERFVRMTVGTYTACGVTREGRALCWGDDGRGQVRSVVMWRLLGSLIVRSPDPRPVRLQSSVPS